MIEAEVLIDNFKDKENFYKKISVKRNNKNIYLENELLQKGDIYPITKERFKYLSSKGIVAKAKKKLKENNDG